MDIATLFNKKTQIITKSKIRYEGEMFKIDSASSTIALKNVVSFGTEGRRPGSEIQAQATVYDYISFKGQDIEKILPINESAGSASEPPGIAANNN